jgi:hypothetical protein
MIKVTLVPTDSQPRQALPRAGRALAALPGSAGVPGNREAWQLGLAKEYALNVEADMREM